MLDDQLDPASLDPVGLQREHEFGTAIHGLAGTGDPEGTLPDRLFVSGEETAFLAGLVREFPDPRIAVAAYNAGPRRVREWWKARRTDDVEAWVELIPFDETRAYVKRVTLSWHEYRHIYGAGR